MGKVPIVPQVTVERMVSLRRDLHRHPELSWKESRTAKRIREELRRLGLEPRTAARNGLIVDIPGEHEGPIVALRADMDALPVQEHTGLPFSSIHEGVMHACGHDGHTSMLVGAAEMLLQDGPPPLTTRLLWQPAEEEANGAPAMVEDGALDGVAMIFGGHVDRHYAPGSLIVTDGCVNASTDAFEIDIYGQGGHGARPHEALDAVVVGSLLVTSLQTIVSREVDPARPSVLTIGTFNAGTASNVIAGSAHMEGTIRAQDEKTRQHLKRSLTRIGVAVGSLHEAQVDVRFTKGTPAVFNTPEPTALAREAALAVVGEEHVGVLRTANMGGEDFAYYLDHVPGCYIRFGAQVSGRENYPAHSSRFDFHEEALGTGAAWYNQVARRAGQFLLDRT